MKNKILALLSIICMSSITQADAPATHGMLLFGDKTAYASHLPMFHKPHDYQLIMKLSLADIPRSETLKLYDLKKKSGKTLFTIVPETMDLTLIMNESKKSFTAALYEGHFERGGINLGTVIVQVDKIIFSKKLNPLEAESSVDYLVFGEKNEYFAAHIIKSKPSFDTILKVSQPTEKLMSFACGRGACPDPILKPAPTIPDAQLPIIISAATLPDVKPVPAKKGSWMIDGLSEIFIEVLDVLYLEENELSH